MSYDRSRGDILRAQNRLAWLTGRGVDLPEAVKSAAQMLEQVSSRTIHPATDADVAAAIVDGKTDRQVIEAATRVAVGDILIRANGRARDLAANAVNTAVVDHADELIEQLRPQWESLIASLKAVAGITEDLGELVRAGRHEDAQAVATSAATLADYADLVHWVASNLLPNNRGIWAVHHYRDPELQVTDVLEVLRTAPDQVWFPTPRQVMELSAELQQQVDNAAAERRYSRG